MWYQQDIARESLIRAHIRQVKDKANIVMEGRELIGYIRKRNELRKRQKTAAVERKMLKFSDFYQYSLLCSDSNHSN